MSATPQDELISILAKAGSGDSAAADRLLPLVYDELRQQAGRFLNQERRGHTLQPTALVHEAYLRMVGQDRKSWESRVHFLSIAATMMRRILVNHAKARGRQKRGGDALRVTLDEPVIESGERELDVAALDHALERLAALDAQQARIVELRFFAGMSADEVAKALDLSERTVHREWSMAKAWLRGELEPSP